MKNHYLIFGAAILGANLTVKAAEDTKPLNACMVQWPPFITVDPKTKEPGGPDTVALKMVAKDIGHDVDIHEIPWKRCLDMAKNGTMDIVYVASYKPERTDALLYPNEPLHETQYVFAVPKGKKAVWSPETAATEFPQPVASVLGYSVTASLKDIEGLQVDDGAANDYQNLAKLQTGRVEAVLIERSALMSLMKKYPEFDFDIVKQPFEDNKAYYITFSHHAGGGRNQAQDILQAVDQSLAKMKADGTLDDMFSSML